MSHVAILGSSGMIGSHLKSLLISKDIDFIDISRNIWDLRDWKSDQELDYIFAGVDTIFHFAAVLPIDNDDIELTFDVNVRSCLNLAKWATKRNKKIIYLSSSSIYENPHDCNIIESSNKVLFGLGGFYGYSKLLSENVFSHYIAQGLNIIILRPTSVYGYKLGQNNLISKFLEKAINNETFTLSESNNKINFIHAMDVSIAALDAYLNKSYGIFNISANKNISIQELAEVCIETVGLGRIGEVIESKDPFVRFDLNCDQAKKSFDYSSKIDIRRGLLAMYKNEYLEGN